jgi:hypothetical protein
MNGTHYDETLARLRREGALELINKAAPARQQPPGARHLDSEVQMQRKSPIKRPHGTGHLFVKAGNWYGQWRVGDRRVKRMLGPVRPAGSREGLTRVMAERELRRRRETEQVATSPERLTVEQAGEQLCVRLELMGRKRSTVEGCRSTLSVHLVPHFGEKPLERIKREDVEELLAQLRRKGLAPKSALNYLGVLNSV